MKKLMTVTTLIAALALPMTAKAATNQGWTQEEQARYLAGVKLAGEDLLTGEHHQPTDPVELAGYQEGLTRGQQWLADHPVSEAPAASSTSTSQVTSAASSTEPTEATSAPSDSGDEQAAPAESLSDGSAVASQAEATVALAADYHERYAPLPLTISQRQFINQVAPAAVKIGQEYDLYPSVMIAQAALESNWGNSDLSRLHHNLFGIKGTGVVMLTTENLGGQDVTITAGFKSYADVSASFADYAKVLNQGLYRGVHRSTTNSYRQATAALTGTYATDPNYQAKLNQLIEAYQLDQYDQQGASPTSTSQAQAAEVTTAPLSSAATSSVAASPANTKETASPVKAGGVPWPVPVAGGAGSVGLLAWLRKLVTK